MSLVINVRGGTGSGKSTAVRHLLRNAALAERISDPWAEGRPLGYRATGLVEYCDIYVVGDYDDEMRTAGGEDVRRRYGTPYVFDLLNELVEHGHVLIEGRTYNTIITMWRRLHEVIVPRGHELIMATLDTSVNQRVANIRARRNLRQQADRPIELDAVRAEARGIDSMQRTQRRAGLECRVVPWASASDVILGWLR